MQVLYIPYALCFSTWFYSRKNRAVLLLAHFLCVAFTASTRVHIIHTHFLLQVLLHNIWGPKALISVCFKMHFTAMGCNKNKLSAWACWALITFRGYIKVCGISCEHIVPGRLETKQEAEKTLAFWSIGCCYHIISLEGGMKGTAMELNGHEVFQM